ncbi:MULTISPECIES: Hok/Gef family protein [Pantoea]|uniref:Hok/Gef family protein n=1 Tax=Pantoea phytobeneficialis TaxID=2052056 RepID=A0AAP9HA10_9GAMM|nr:MULTISPECIES: Hok/Gef family protein [Pantoea]MDO6407526.1 Hok/Gef family protein [Pantoea phytobeneficialis]QGR09428.1 Hok/Gef family protein [Pantoea phytobeneficialis]
MKQQTVIIITALILVTATAVLLVVRKELCEVRFRTGVMEVAVSLAYESRK